jgi:hypothetical protein
MIQNEIWLLAGTAAFGLTTILTMLAVIVIASLGISVIRL